jgi:hypothetical protein
MNSCHRRPKSDHLTRLFTVVALAVTLSAVPSMSQTNTFPPSGNVGINTSGPYSNLTVIGTSVFGNGVFPVATFGLCCGRGGWFSNNENGFLFFGNMQPGVATDRGGAIYLGARNTTGVDDFAYSKIVGARADAVDGSSLTYLAFSTSLAERMRIDKNGNVGIGTTTPASKLDINGNVNVSGNIAAKYQDVAEWVPATETMEPGTVVVLNPERANEVMPSTLAYDTTVVGVVSANPGLILGESGASKAQIAASGRVRVKASATKAPIHIGDLLVTSGKTGVAMKSEPIEIAGHTFHQPGTIIGKALEPLVSGEGEILVLLSLQ